MKNFKLYSTKFYLFLSSVFLLTPVLTLAQSSPQPPLPDPGLAGIIESMIQLLGNSVVKLIFAIAFVYFFWGVVQYVISPSQEKKDQGRNHMIWGLIALTVMFSVYALLAIIRKSFSIEDKASEFKVPDLPGSN